MRFKIAVLAFLIAPSSAMAADYRCDVEAKYDFGMIYTQSQIEKFQYKVLIQDNGKTAKLSRCSFSQGVQKITCDTYDADKIISDPYVHIKKYYDFTGQWDVQLFPSLSFVENNGRGGVAYGKCELVAP